MRKLLLELHAYCGIACTIPLLAFGFSSLNFNHHFGWMESTPTPKNWETQIEMPNLESDQELADAIKDSLNLMGWTPWWIQDRQPDKYEFRITHFGKDYDVTSFQQTGKVKVVEKRKGMWATFNSLHFLGGTIPNAPVYVNLYQYYQDFIVIFILFSIITGVYLWFSSHRSPMAGWVVFGSFFVLSATLMLYIWLLG